MSALKEATRRTRRRATAIAGEGRLAGARVRGPIPLRRRAAVLLASEGREFSTASIALAADLAQDSDSSVLVMSVARVHGVAFGLPHPGLAPTAAEWAQQEAMVQKAVKRLRRKGLKAEGQVLGTRTPAKRICAMADEIGADAIVMGADTARARLMGATMWSQEPQGVKRKAKVPVHLLIANP